MFVTKLRVLLSILLSNVFGFTFCDLREPPTISSLGNFETDFKTDVGDRVDPYYVMVNNPLLTVPARCVHLELLMFHVPALRWLR